MTTPSYTYMVIGAGMMGRAIALDLARADDTGEVVVADIDEERAGRIAAALPGGKGRGILLDATSRSRTVEAMRSVACVIGATSYTMNEQLTRCAIDAGRHFLDLGGNSSVVRAQKGLDAQARERNILVVPNCGLAPGMALVLAAGGAQEFESLDTIRIRVGGLPRHPRPPFNYQKVFSIEGLLNEYSGTSEVIREGRISHVEALSEVEPIAFPEPFGSLEAFHTSGGTSMLPQMFEGKVRELDYKTIRYPGHCERMRTLFDIGFASLDPVQLGSGVFTERELFSQLLDRRLPSSGPDVVLVRVDIRGVRKGQSVQLRLQIVDFGDDSDNISAMMRTTAYPTSLIAQMNMRSIIERRGVATPEECVPLPPFLDGMEERGIRIERMVAPLA